MKKEFLSSLLLSIFCLILFSGLYPLLMLGIAGMAPNSGNGFIVMENGKNHHSNIAQQFTKDEYFWPRPSAVNYNAAASAGSNKGPTNPDYLAQVHQRIDTFLAHNPKIRKQDITSDMVTASGSGLDPDISVRGALIQIDRIANARGLAVESVKNLVKKNTEKPLWNLLGPEKVNVLKLNIELDNLK